MTYPEPYPSSLDPYSREMSATALKAPAGTDPYTLWIWLILAIPIVQLLPLFFIDWAGYVDATIADPTGLGAYSMIFSPAFIALQAASWIGIGLMIWFAYLDWRDLQARGVPQPFHWAWIFLTLVVSYAVYTIGRSVVVVHRTGRGWAPMWITIATFVVTFVVIIWFMVALFETFFNAAMVYGY